MTLDHEKLDVYRVALEFVSRAFEVCKMLSGAHRHARDQLLRASQSIVQNIAEGNGKRSFADRRRFFEIARGSAFECAATLDVLRVCGAISVDEATVGKVLLDRVVSMLTKMTENPAEVREDSVPYGMVDYEHEHRCAEHAHGRHRARARTRGAQ
jgi:four helix bundle protein